VKRLRIVATADVSPLAVIGGAERVLWEHVRRLARRGHDVRVLCRGATEERAPRTIREGVEIVEFASIRRSPVDFVQTAVFGARRAVTELLAARGADVLNVYQPLSGYGVLGSAAARRLPALYSFMSPAPLEYRSRQRSTAHHRAGAVGLVGLAALWMAERACLRRAARVQVHSDFSRALLWKLYRMPAERSVTISGGVDVERFRPARDRRDVRAALGLPLDRPILLTVRNLEARMGLDTLIEAMVPLARRVPGVLLLVGGSGSRRAALEALVRALGLDKHVAFLGFVPEAELPSHYQAADVFVLPTRELEGFGLVTAEALACGTPVLGTRVGATPELLDPLDAGLVFREATAEAMAADLGALLARLLADPAGAEALRTACRRHAETRFGWERVVDDLEATLIDVAAGGAPAPAALGPGEACGAALRPSRLLYGGRRYARCARCGARRVVALPTERQTRHEYQVRYARRFPPGRIDPARQRVLASIAAGARQLAPPGRLLDVGCGGGHFMTAARVEGWRPIGIDLSHAACMAAHGATAAPAVGAAADALPFRAAALDAVALVNVLDHTTRPRAIVGEAARVLRPGGLLIVRVPNGAFHPPWVRALGSLGPLVRWGGWDAYPILHLFAFGPTALCRLVERAGFEVLATRSSGLASPEPGPAGSGPAAVGRRLLRAVTVAAAGAAHAFSGRRWVIGPSIELYARRLAVRAVAQGEARL
jgi:glycosyltransferase involved in cell wall biosynthesis/SAM-dependent methyltransferase